ncbi:MAG: hypothetical protein ACO3ZW_03075 [Opitutales bacterium]
MRNRAFVLLVVICGLLSETAVAGGSLSGVFSDHMILQRDQENPI